MEKSAAFMLGFQQGLDPELGMEKIAEIVDILERYGNASELEKRAMWGKLTQLIKGLLSRTAGGAMKKIPPAPKKKPLEGIRSPMSGGGSTKSW